MINILEVFLLDLDKFDWVTPYQTRQFKICTWKSRYAHPCSKFLINCRWIVSDIARTVHTRTYVTASAEPMSLSHRARVCGSLILVLVFPHSRWQIRDNEEVNKLTRPMNRAFCARIRPENKTQKCSNDHLDDPVSDERIARILSLSS